MNIFHVISCGAPIRAMEIEPVPVLASAYAYHFQASRWNEHSISVLHNCRPILSDSGMISALTDNPPRLEWANEREKVMQFASLIEADYEAHLDIPCEKDILKRAGKNLDWSLSKTIENAKWRLNQDANGRKIIYVIQGQKLKDYQYCAEELESIGCWESEKSVVGLGSTCKRTPRDGLYEICKWARSRFPDKYIHAFGVGSAEYIVQLERIGIDSVDSGDVVCLLAHNQLGPQNLDTPPKMPLDYYAYLFHLNRQLYLKKIEIARDDAQRQQLLFEPFLDRGNFA